MAWIRTHLILMAWMMATVATLGSLAFSELLHYPPCVLCWYQRIAMYPLVVILAVGYVTKDAKVWLYALPLSIAGLLIGIYHNLLYYNILPEAAAPCINGVSCTTVFINWFGFITIPLLSLLAFVAVTGLLVWYKRSLHEQGS